MLKEVKVCQGAHLQVKEEGAMDFLASANDNLWFYLSA